jgi:hypothetical protein
MIRQEKRKHRWLEKNGFELLTKDNVHVVRGFYLDHSLLAHRADLAHEVVFAYRAHIIDEKLELYVLTHMDYEFELFEMKIDYRRWMRQKYPNKNIWVKECKFKLKRFNRQCHALIRYGVNPWW